MAEYYVMSTSTQRLPVHYLHDESMRREAARRCHDLYEAFNGAARQVPHGEEVKILSAHAGDRPVLRVEASDAAAIELENRPGKTYLMIRINKG